ncbi:hypothetical protein GCM10025771_39880 [Niveibacterium umoris]|uniref:DUF1631 family protein n=1 Tax=Niveibacterium umoris TaxID=1193620 RepID=A0A840BCQ2_9RHOO|nr:hypothetical protein [Niveibacterium umoris]
MTRLENTKIVEITGGASASQRQLVREMQDLFSRHLSDWLAQVRTPVLVALYEQAANATSSREQEDAIALCRIFESTWSAFPAVFMRHVRNGVAHARADERAFGDLYLFDDAEMENLRLANAVSGPLREAAGEELHALDERIGGLLGLPRAQHAFGNPMGPTRLSHALIEGCKVVDAPPAVRDAFARVVANRLAVDLPTVYQEINAELAARGVGIERTRERFIRKHPTLGSGAPASIERHRNAAIALHDALKVNERKRLATGKPSEMSKICSYLHDALAEPAQGTDAAPLAVMLNSAPLSTASAPIRTLLSLADEVFAGLLETPDLPPIGRRLLAALKRPLMILALSDEALFATATHPAIRLIDAVVDASRRCNASVDGGDKVSARLNAIVQQLHADTAPCSAHFVEALASLEAFTAARDRAEAAASASLLATIERNARDATALKSATDLLRPLCAGPLPEEMRNFLLHAWIPIIQAAIVSGARERELGILHGMAARLVRTVDPAQTDAERAEIRAGLRALIEEVTLQLEASDLPAEVWAVPLAALLPVQIRALQGRPIETRCSDLPSLMPAMQAPGQHPQRIGVFEVTEVPDQSPDDITDCLAREALAAAGNLAPGDWVVFARDDGAPEVMQRLVWTSKAGDHHVFTSFESAQATSVSSSALAAMLLKNRARLVARSTRFDALASAAMTRQPVLDAPAIPVPLRPRAVKA